MRTSVEECGALPQGLTVYQSRPGTAISARPAVAVDSKNHALALAPPRARAPRGGVRLAGPDSRARGAPGAARGHHPAPPRSAGYRRPPGAGAGDPEPAGVRRGHARARHAAQPQGRRVRDPARRHHRGHRRAARERPGAPARDPAPRGRDAVGRAEQLLIPGVLGNRRKIGLPLQADPTVQYAVAKERRALSRADLVIDHPYNTYVHAGLPPGPIASPGLEAIHAALDPAPVKYLYFVARDDRRHHFSTTVDEHNAAVARYRLSRRLSRR